MQDGGSAQGPAIRTYDKEGKRGFVVTTKAL